MTSSETQAGDEGKKNGEGLERIFIELGNQNRLDILAQLAEKKKARLSLLSEDLNLPMPEIHRNTTRLQEAGLIKRDPEVSAAFMLSTFGNAIIKQIPTFGFLSRYRQYFSEHTFGKLPDRYIRDIGALEKSKFVDGITGVFDVMRAIIKGADQFLYGLVLQLGGDLTELAASQTRDKGLRLKYILPANARVGIGYYEIEKKYKFSELIAKGVLERRITERIDVVIILNENQACVMFPNENGLTDFNRTFYGADKMFYDWCMDYFQYRWNNASPYDRSKFQII